MKKSNDLQNVSKHKYSYRQSKLQNIHLQSEPFTKDQLTGLYLFYEI